MASETRKRKREFQVDMDEMDLSFNVEGCGFLPKATTSKRRRQTIHGSSIRQIKKSPFKKDTVCRVENKEPIVRDNLRGTLRRRLSAKLFQHKMKKLQDYSLSVPEMDNFAILRSMNQNTVTKKTPSKLKAKPVFTLPSLPENDIPVTEHNIAIVPQNTYHKMVITSSGNITRYYPIVLSDHDLQQKIDHEIKMREGTAKLLAASKHPNQMLEAAKNLLSSNTRIISYMTELQKRKTAEVMGKNMAVEGNQLPCRATVSLSDLRIPLMWKDTDHFKNKGDYRRYAVFCLLKIGTEIYDTSMISNVDRSMTDITFDDIIVFNNIPHDFDCKVEVFCHKLHEDLSMANTPKKLRKKINDLSGSVGRSVGKRLSGLNDADIIGNMVLGPKFEMVAKGSLSLTDVDDSVRTFDLTLETTSDGTIHELPLFGHYCCRLAALPLCLVEPTVTGFLNLQDGEDDVSKWKRYWCVLKNLQLACWSSPNDVEVTQPLVAIPVTKSTQICDADPTTSQRSHTFHIKTTDIHGITQHTLAADSKDDLSQWWDGFQQHLLDQALWKHAVEYPMDVKQSSVRRSSVFQRKSSIYDDTPLIEAPKRASLVDLKVEDDQLNKMLHTLMGEQKEIRGSGTFRQNSTS